MLIFSKSALWMLGCVVDRVLCICSEWRRIETVTHTLQSLTTHHSCENPLAVWTSFSTAAGNTHSHKKPKCHFTILHHYKSAKKQSIPTLFHLLLLNCVLFPLNWPAHRSLRHGKLTSQHHWFSIFPSPPPPSNEDECFPLHTPPTAEPQCMNWASVNAVV